MSKRKKYPLRIPKHARGIRVQDVRNGIGRSWWVRRWLSKLEDISLRGRFGSGRNYAASGQVVAFSIKDNLITAKVQGMRDDPYLVTIKFSKPAASVKRRIISEIREHPMWMAQMLADELPLELEECFRNLGAYLLPGGKLASGKYDVTFNCNCPDYLNPCKHTVAVLFVLIDELTRHPAKLLELRGFKLEELYES